MLFVQRNSENDPPTVAGLTAAEDAAEELRLLREGASAMAFHTSPIHLPHCELELEFEFEFDRELLVVEPLAALARELAHCLICSVCWGVGKLLAGELEFDANELALAFGDPAAPGGSELPGCEGSKPCSFKVF